MHAAIGSQCKLMNRDVFVRVCGVCVCVLRAGVWCVWCMWCVCGACVCGGHVCACVCACVCVRVHVCVRVCVVCVCMCACVSVTGHAEVAWGYSVHREGERDVRGERHSRHRRHGPRPSRKVCASQTCLQCWQDYFGNTANNAFQIKTCQNEVSFCSKTIKILVFSVWTVCLQH